MKLVSGFTFYFFSVNVITSVYDIVLEPHSKEAITMKVGYTYDG